MTVKLSTVFSLVTNPSGNSSLLQNFGKCLRLAVGAPKLLHLKYGYRR